MAAETYIGTKPMRNGPSRIVKTQGDVAQTVPGPNLCNKSCGINRNFLKVTHIDYYNAVPSTKTISNIAMLESLSDI